MTKFIAVQLILLTKLISYALILLMDLSERISFQNSHWGKGEINAWPVRRDIFNRLWQDLFISPIIFLTGSRRTGKSVLLKQFGQELITVKNVKPTQILFFEFAPQDSQEIIWQVINYFTREVAESQERRFIFLDELQFVLGYEAILKEIYDNETNLKIVVTGSLSLDYKRRMQESLAGRFFLYRLFPLNFKEYLHLSNDKNYELWDKTVEEKDKFRRLAILKELNDEFRRFLAWGRLPEMINLTEEQGKSYLSSITGQSLTRDAFNYFSIEKPQAILAIFDYIRFQNGSLISIQNLAQVLGVNAATISRYLSVLESMGLVYLVYNSVNPLVKANSAKKAYVSSMFGLWEAKVDWSTALGFAAESYVLERLLEQDNRVTFFRKRNWEIDFLLPKEKTAYEVKFRSEGSPVPKAPAGYQLKIVSADGDLPVCLF